MTELTVEVAILVVGVLLLAGVLATRLSDRFGVPALLLFLLLEISPGNVATKVLGPYSSEEQRNLWLEQHGYFEPLWVRYFSWLGNFATGDLGESIRFKGPVADVMWPRLWNTVVLGFWVFAIMVPISLCSTLVGMPVDGPVRCTLKSTAGSSV